MSIILPALFFASGVAGLVFETLWFRQAGLTFGNSIWASSLVLSSFMAGLALGNGLVAGLGGRIRRPVRLYAWLEVAIATAGVGLVWLLPGLGGWLAPLLRPFLDQPWILNPLRLGSAFALLLLPATAMGATLPVLVMALRKRDPSFGGALGRLYGWNTLGAVIGAAAGEVLLIEQLGVRGTAGVAAGLDLGAAAVALALARRFDGRAHVARPADRGVPAREARRTWNLLAATFAAGFALLALEVVWFRFLQLFVAPSGLAFALMLAVVLAGIGFGGLWAGIWLRRDANAPQAAAALALLAGALTLALYGGFGSVVAPFSMRRVLLAPDVLRLAAALMLPTALMSGALFALIGAALREAIPSDVRAAGLLTLANTTGGGVGSFLAGFALLPLLATQNALLALAVLYGVVALLLWPLRSRARRPWLLYAGAVGFVAAIALFPFDAMERRYLDQAARPFGYPKSAKLAALREGRTETIVLLRGDLLGEPEYYRLVTGGFGMASTRVLNRRYMNLFVYWPVALHGEIRSALLISYGIGNTARAMVATRGLERIDVVDISREILELGDVIYPESGENPLRDPRVHAYVEDGRYFLQTRERRYDLITAEPPPPKHAGVVSLYTREYFELIRKRLAEGGINTYWLPVHSLTESDTKAIIRAYCEVFTDCTLWSGWEWNWMLAGSRDARWQRSESVFTRQWRDPEVAPELKAVGFELPEQIGALFLADAADLAAYTRDAEPLTDNFPKRIDDRYLDSRRKLAIYGRWLEPEGARERFLASAFVREAWPAELIPRSRPYFSYQRALNELIAGLSPTRIDLGRIWESMHDVLTRTPLETLFLWHLAISEDELGAMARLLAQGQPQAPHLARLGAVALAERDWDRAARYYSAAQRSEPGLLYLRVYALCRAGRVAEAEQAVRQSYAGLPRGAADRGFWELMNREFDLTVP